MPADGLFGQLLDEHCGPYQARVGGERFELDAPAGEIVASLDDETDPNNILDLLAGEDTADEICDLLDDRPAHELVDLLDGMRRHWAIHRPPRQGMGVVVDEINRYGAAIEADLVFSGSGLLLIDWFRRPNRYPWSLLLRLLEHMPPGGFYQAAREDDDELAARIDDAIRAGDIVRKPPRMPLLGHTQDRELMAAMVDSLRRIEHAIPASSPKFKGKGGRGPKGLKRPVRASDRLAEQRSFAVLDEIAARMLGDRHTAVARRRPPDRG